MNMRFNNIIFDFDGTLVDSRPGVAKTFKRVVGELASKKINERKIIKLIGFPLAQIISIILDTNDQAIIKQGSELFKKYYDKEGFCWNIIYPGIREMLKLFKARSCRLFIVSNKISLFINKILEQHNLKKYFTFVHGTDGTDKQSKKAEYVKYIMARYKLKKKETAMVGDTESDIIAAKTNSIYSIGAAWGYGSKSDLIKTKVDAICRSPLELKQFIK